MSEIEKKEKSGKDGFIQVLKYTFFAASAGLVEVVTFIILIWGLKLAAGVKDLSTLPTFNFLYQEMDWISLVSHMISLALSVVWNFIFNRKFTFKSNANVPKVLALAFAFYIPFYPASAIYVGALARPLTLKWGEKAALSFLKATAMIANFVLEFIWQKFFMYRNSENSAVEAKAKDSE